MYSKSYSSRKQSNLFNLNYSYPIPRSPDVQVSQGRIEEAKRFLLKVAKSRQINIDEELKQLDYASKREKHSKLQEEFSLKEIEFEGLKNGATKVQSNKDDIVYER